MVGRGNVPNAEYPTAGADAGRRRSPTDNEGPDRERRTSFAAFFEDRLPTIRRVLAVVARQHRLDADEAEELASVAYLRLSDRDYAILRKFRGDCALPTFLTVVLHRICLDYRIQQWGKCRRSAGSRRGGEVAVRLERLVVRDGLTFDDACSVIEINHRLTVDRDALWRICARFRMPPRLCVVADEELHNRPATSGAADRLLVSLEHRRVVAHAAKLLDDRLTALAVRDRLILQLHIADGMTIAAVARLLRIPAKPMYGRVTRLVRDLRASLEQGGVNGAEVIQSLTESDASPEGNVGSRHRVVQSRGRTRPRRSTAPTLEG